MKTKIYSLLFACATLPLLSQVGINTTTPTATLDVNGTLKVRDTPAATALPGYQVLAINQGSSEVYKMDPLLLMAGGSTSNTTVYAAKKSTTLSVLSVGVFPGGFKALNFKATDRTVGNAALFDDNDGSYIIPSTGVYAVGFAFKYATGLVASLLSEGGIGIARTRGGTSAIIDSSMFSGLNILVTGLSFADTRINSLYSFQAGDKINFGTIETGLLNLGALSTSNASIYIYKVSD
ncbi:hypothetical protein EGY05_05475 [Chryseobacterium arthrosphaerae]|uniref:hypothetical protein n=1 Tax=Chryseobacterium arthrosphaerae TaxID=651561 RepID=UPI000F4FE8C5|nr:hypothetical protein [Chryseobacterium arthrosphaerae]AYZ11407.1 hypothetical protein EGY05_05475 [Chryseobacterium arthrosphaerae]